MNRILLAFGALLVLFAFSGQAALDSEEAQFLSFINTYRADSSECYDLSQGWITWPQGSVRTLTEAPSLSTAADGHNMTMISGGCFSHQCPGEPAYNERANNAGYTGWTYLSENIAYGTTMGAQEAFNAWANSPGHNQNMLGCRAVAIGIAREQGNDIQGWRWTTMFGDVIQLGAQPAPPPIQDPPPSNDPPPPTNPPPSNPPPSDPPPSDPQPPANAGSGPSRYDTDGDCEISSPEFFVALDDWLAGTIDDVTFFGVSDLWISGGNACAASASGVVAFDVQQNAVSKQVTFSAQGADVFTTGVQIYSLSGKQVFRSRAHGQELRWNLRSAQNGSAVANGVYVFRVRAWDANGHLISTHIDKIYVLR